MSYISKAKKQPNLSKNEMVRDMWAQGQFFYHKTGAPGLQLVQRRSSVFLAQPNDFLLFGRLDKKIKNAVEWPLSSFDLPVIRALSELRVNDTDKYLYIVLALYLYLADVVTIYPNSKNMSFLSACVEAGFVNDSDKTPIKQKFIRALEDLGIYQYQFIKDLVEEWEQFGTFKVDKVDNMYIPTAVDNWDEGKIETKGIYATLARTLARNRTEAELSPVMLMNNCIAYALHVKESYSGVEPLSLRKKEVLRHAGLAGRQISVAMNDAIQGHAIRTTSLKNLAIEKESNLLAYSYDKNLEANFFTRIFSELPEQVTAIYYLSDMEIAYSEEFGLRGIYPKDDLPGYLHSDCETSRSSKGLNNSRFKIAMFSSDELDNNLSQDHKDMKLRHTVSHEAFHIALGANGILNADLQMQFEPLKQKRKEMLDKAPAVLRKITNSQTPELKQILDMPMRSTGFTFRELIDENKYTNYFDPSRAKDSEDMVKTEEMLCNLYALTQNELANSQYLHALNYNHSELNDIQNLTRGMGSLVAETISVFKQNLQDQQQQQFQRQ